MVDTSWSPSWCVDDRIARRSDLERGDREAGPDAGTPNQHCMQPSSINCMHTTSVRIDSSTHSELKRLAADLGSTVGQTVTLAVRRLRQDHIGHQLNTKLTADETAWLDAELG